jgi:Hydrazine synthase alpha subunit middle domain/WD40-like Beta Propeller Repeat
MTIHALHRYLNNREKPAALGAVTAAALLAACSGGDGSVGIGTGQDPDPVAVDFPIAYTKGPLFDENMVLQSSTDLRELDRFNVGTDLFLRDRASPSALERNITVAETQGLGDVRDVQISADGTRLLFAMRGPFDENLALEDQPTWNIWEYDIPSDTLRRIIVSDILAEDGQDISPNYLPDGRIIFSSTRQRTAKAVLLDEGKPQFEALDEDRNEFASVLHVMNDDGTDLHQVSFNQSHDYYPTVLSSGQILFSRWDRAGNVNGIHLYRMNPDGSALELNYGAESHMTGTGGTEVEFINAHEMMDGRVMAIVRPFTHPELGGDVAIIDTNTYVENTQPNAANPGMTGPAQTSATSNSVRTDLLPSPGGRFSSAFPLWDGSGRVFASWSNCRVVINNAITACTPTNLADPNVVVAPPLYGIWMYDPVDQTQLPVVVGEEGVFIADVVAAQPRPMPPVIIDLDQGGGGDTDWMTEGVGVINIRSVYDLDGVDVATPSIEGLADPAIATADQRPARFVRFVKAVSIPDDDLVDLNNTAFGPNIRQGMREIIGYAPVEPDGSVRVKVPANVALAIDVLDADGHRIFPRHQNWLQVRPGQELRCNGCHDPQSGLSHGNMASFNAVYAGAQTTGVPFPNTVNTLVPDFGDTMAETRTRVSCQTDCAALDLSFDLIYQDVWTDPAVRAPDAEIRYAYSGLSTPAPTLATCMSTWTNNCRAVINYETHIHPLWALPRQILDVDGVTVLQDNTCQNSGCHAPLDAMNMTAVPAAQLDLTDGLSPDQMDHFNSYRELLFADNEQEVVNGALQDVVIDIGPDANGNPVLVNVSVAAAMSAAGADASGRFFSRFATGGTHEGYLTEHELRLIAEWLDIGAQYYNNPFDVPVN